MSKPSNLYAEKIYSEQPLALWSLDEDVDYIPLAQDFSDLSTWTITNGSIVETTTQPSQPFIDSSLFLVTGNPSTTEIQYTTLVSEDVANFNDLNQILNSFCIGTYFYSDSVHLYSVSVGYEYYDVASGINVQQLKDFSLSINEKWMLLSETFTIPYQNTTMRAVIKIGYIPSAQDSSHYQFLINGFSVGQWSEEFIADSMGLQNMQTLPSDIAVPNVVGTKCVPADAYGLTTNNGYYVISGNSLLARNTGVPLVYGASNTTVISPSNVQDGDGNRLPSLLIPGLGFLNELGRYKEYTVEMWLRITSDATDSKRIFGPVGSDDGLYVDGAFLTMVAGDSFSSKYVGDWCRPMLIQITYITNNVSVILNGETVISLTLDTSTMPLPSQFNSSNKNQDWLGFWAYDDIYPIEIDCLAIYPYKVAEVVAKRRWTYGQAVPSTENVNSSYNGTSASIDYAFAGYTSNYNYPKIGSWQQGVFDNLATDNVSLQTPTYELPDIVYSIGSLEDSYNTLKEENLEWLSTPENYPYFSLGDSKAYFKFKDLNVLNDDLKSFYGVFSIDEAPTEEQTLFVIENKVTLDKLVVSILNSDINYKLYTGSDEILLGSVEYTPGDIFGAGLDINSLVEKFGNDVSTFFGNRNLLTLYVLNNKTFLNKFAGKMYKVGLSTKRNFAEISDHFGSDGILFEHNNLIDFVASYTLIPEIEYGKYYLDIAVSGYWEDYIPLTYFAKYVTDNSGNQRYDLDLIQFNIDYPSPASYKTLNEVSEWKYWELQEQFALPVQQTYDILDNSLYTGYSNYDDLAHNRSSFTYEYNTSKSMVRSYISFQFIEDGANKDRSLFLETAPALRSGVADASQYYNWQNTKFEVVNDTIIYPPQSVDFNDLALVVHLNFKTNGILGKQIKLRSLELASRALNESLPNPITTKSGVSMYPYSKSGIYYDQKIKNPISIYKKSNPYLHLTRYSGIQVRGTYDPLIVRGLSIPINASKVLEYRVNAIQFATRFDDDFFPATPYEVFEIKDSGSTIKFYMVANSTKGDRAKIYAVNAKTGKLQDGISYYLNGKLVSSPILTVKQWAFIGISFGNPLTFSGYSGYISLNGPLLFNHISYYRLTSLQQKQSSSPRIWDEVKQQYLPGASEPQVFDWEYWNLGYVWYGVLVRSSSYSYGTTPSDIYRTYMGTNKIIIDTQKELKVSLDPINIEKSVKWDQYVQIPV